jgi:LAS superfamily LD-carboxypeptidase LdcB
MKTINPSPHTFPKYLPTVFWVFVVIMVGFGIYSFLRMNKMSDDIVALNSDLASLNTNLASTSKHLQELINDSHNALSSAIHQESTNVGNIQQQLGGFQSQVGSLSGTLTTLQKLAQTDPELLKKYSKYYFLNENYVPAHLSEIPNTYQYSDKKQLLIHTNVLPHLESMIDSATASGIKLYAFSAYRSFAEQRALKGNYTFTYGSGTANSFSADQGYSEHQLGTTLDFITSGLGGVLDGFDSTSAYTWMQNNAYRYGFILSYPKGNGYFVYEPWHWRFVGVKLAADLHNQGKNFYDFDQRMIDEYLVNIFD